MRFTHHMPTARRAEVFAWIGAVTPRVDGFIRIRSSACDAAYVRFGETAPPD